MIPKLREVMEIDRAKMRVRIFLPKKVAKSMKDKLDQMVKHVEADNWIEGDLELVRTENEMHLIQAPRAVARGGGQGGRGGWGGAPDDSIKPTGLVSPRGAKFV